MEHRAHCHQFDNGTVRLAIVDARVLSEAAHHPSHLVPIEAPVFLEFVTEDPFAADDVRSRWTRNEFPGVVGDQGVELGLHSLGPIGVLEGLMHRAWD